MQIDVNQTSSEKKNEFEILYNGKKIFTAITPFLSIPFIDGFLKTKIFDLENNQVYSTSYHYIENKIEELIPLKYLVTSSQKYNQFLFLDSRGYEECSIYFEQSELFSCYYIIKRKDSYYKCYLVEDGYIIHVSIYDEEKQIAELLKPQVVINGNDTYKIFLQEEYKELAISLSFLALYLDRMNFNSSYLKNKSQVIVYQKSYSKINSYYNPNWVRDNFDSKEYFDQIERGISRVKCNVKSRAKKLLKLMVVVWTILLMITAVILVIIFL